MLPIMQLCLPFFLNSIVDRWRKARSATGVHDRTSQSDMVVDADARRETWRELMAGRKPGSRGERPNDQFDLS